MRLLAVIFGIALIVLVALDAFETIVLPRRVTRRIRLTRLFYRVFQFGSTSLGRPAVVLGRALRRGLWAHHVGIGTSPEQSMSFLTDLYLSGTTFFTLGLGDVTPLSGVGRLLLVT